MLDKGNEWYQNIVFIVSNKSLLWWKPGLEGFVLDVDIGAAVRRNGTSHHIPTFKSWYYI